MIHIDNLSFYYKKKKPILSNLSTELAQGKIYGLFGVNGSGKTTLLHTLSGMNFPKEGTIKLNGFQPKDRKLGFFQQIFFVPDAVELPKMKIATYINIYSVFYPNFSESKLNEYLKILKIDASESLNNMSFGQQKKFHLAFAMACNTKILLLDEPTNGLDIPSKDQFRKLMLQQMTNDKIVIISTHQARDLDQIIDHVLLVHDKKILVDESIYKLSQKVKLTTYENKDALPKDSLLNYKSGIRGIEALTLNTTNDFSDLPIEFFIQTCIEKPEIIKKHLTN